MQELATNFKLFRSGGERYKLRFYVGHDGSMVRLAALLGFGKNGPLRWPALGSEIVMEVWRAKGSVSDGPQEFVRVMHEGTPVTGLEWMPLDGFISLVEAQVPDNLFAQCMSS